MAEKSGPRRIERGLNPTNVVPPQNKLIVNPGEQAGLNPTNAVPPRPKKK